MPSTQQQQTEHSVEAQKQRAWLDSHSFKTASHNPYDDLLRRVFDTGRSKKDRTGTGTRSIFGAETRFDLTEGFPLVTTKKVHLKSIITELLWFLTGETNNNWLKERGCTIWDEWAEPDGSLGPVYGHQWRHWPGKSKMYRSDLVDPANYEVTGYHVDEDNKGIVMVTPRIDQIEQALDLLRSDPDSRRIIVSAWNVADLPSMALSPCHVLFQFYSEEMTIWEKTQHLNWATLNLMQMKGMSLYDAQNHLAKTGTPTRRLSCRLDQRSLDTFLGGPFNVASYALLTLMFAQQTNHAVGDFIWQCGDVHVYSNHEKQVELQLSREQRQMPVMFIDPDVKSIYDYTHESFKLMGYDPHPAIKAPVAV